MNTFSATTESEAVVEADRAAIWAALTDPELLPRLTPLLERIETDGDLWRWHMKRIAALGISIVPSFTERMVFQDGERIDYSHEPPAGTHERSGAEGWYVLTDHPKGTKLSISLTLHIEVPLPRTAGPAVRRIMQTTMDRTGDRFSANLMRHLGIDEKKGRPSASRR